MKRNILDRIAEGSIETNFHLFPEEVAGFKREDLVVSDDTAKVHVNYAGYKRDGARGYVTADDLTAGFRRVRKIKQIRPEGGGRKVAIPSERFF